MVRELNENAPRYRERIRGLQNELFEHQKTTLYHMLVFEENGYYQKNSLEEDVYIKLGWGILANEVGSGKSHIVPSMIQAQSCQRPYHMIQGSNLSQCIFHPRLEEIKSSLLIVPHNLMPQWKNILYQFTELDWISMNHIGHCTKTNEERWHQCDLVLLNYNLYRKIQKNIETYLWNRVFVDEIQVFHKRFTTPPARFTWFITATPDSYLFTKYGAPYSIRQMTGTVENRIPPWMIQFPDSYIIRCQSSFIHQSLQLPPYQHHIIRCRSPTYLRELAEDLSNGVGLFQRHEINALIQHDFKYFSSRYGKETKTIEEVCENLGHRILRHIRELQIKVDTFHAHLADINDDNERERNIYLTRYEKYKKLLQNEEQKYNDLKERIQGEQWCTICYNDFTETRVTTQCCGHSFCVSCLFQSFRHGQTCPICRHKYKNGDTIFYFDKEKLNPSELFQQLNDTSQGKDKITTLFEFIQEPTRHHSKILIFLPNDHEQENIARRLRRENYSFCMLKGTGKQIDTMIQQYNAGNIPILLLNANYYGCGLNLEQTDYLLLYHQLDKHMEQQVIGRAQRIGRKKPLHVYSLQYSSEEYS